MGSVHDRYVHSRFKIKIEIGGVTFDDEVVSFAARYALNDIPTATATIACGINTKTNQPSKIHTALDGLRAREEAKVTLTIETVAGKTVKSPPGEHVIFEGYYIGVGMQRSNTNANYMLHFVHWLDDLNTGSALNGNFYPGSPADMAQPAGYWGVGQQQGSGLGPPVPFIDPDGKLATVGNMRSDLWGSVLKPMFENMSEFKYPFSQGTCGDRDNNKKLVQKALKKMPDSAPKPGKLPMRIEGVNARLLSLNVRKGLTDTMLNNVSYNSFWSKLVGELAPSFLFGVSPSATFANVIPFFGGLKIDEGSAWRTIHLDDYNYANFNSNMGQLIESVNIFYAMNGNSNVFTARNPGDPKIDYCPAFGKFPQPGAIKDGRGVIMVKQLPMWLHNTTPVEWFAPGTALTPYVDTHKPGGSTTPSGPAPIRHPDTIKNHKLMVDIFAEHWYKTMVLGQRYGEFSGKLRFDIAPGSMIAIEVPPAPPPINPLKGGQEPLYLYASVSGVSFVINAEQHSAGTSFTIANIRNKADNDDSTFTADPPPLYTEKWVGGPLTEKAVNDNK